MTNDKNKTKVNKFLDLKYVLIVSGIVLVVFGLFKYFTSSDSVDNNNKEEIKEEITSEVLYTKTEEGLNKIITSKFGDKELSIVCSKIDDSSCELKVNNKFVLNNNVDVVVESIHRVGDSLVILASEASSNSGYLYFINSDGSVNNVIGNRLENSLSFSLNMSLDKFKVEGSKIYFEMSSIREKSKLLVNGNLLVDVLTESEKLSQYNINDESVVEALYEIEYLGNGKFSDMKVIDSTTCKALIEELSNKMSITSQLVYDVRDESKKDFPVIVEINQKSVVIDRYVPEPGALSYLKIDDLVTDIKLSNGLRNVERIYIVDNFIAIETIGTDINSTQVKFYDINGSLIKDITNPVMNGLKFSIGSYMSDNDEFLISENKLTVIYTSTTHGISLVMEDGNIIEISQEDELTKRGIVDSTSIEVVAEYEYLGNGEFSEMKIVKEYSFKELKDKLN